MPVVNKTFALLFMLLSLSAWAADNTGATIDPATDELITTLVERGVLPQETAAALRQRIEQNAATPTKPAPAANAVPAATEELIKTLIEQGLLPKETAEALQHRIEQNATAKPAPAENVIRVPYVPETVKDQIRDQIKQDVLAQAHQERWGEPGALPEWINRIKWDGDLRLRYEWDLFQKENAPFPNIPAINSAGSTTAAGQNALLDTTDDRTRWRLRARLGMLAKVSDGVEAGFRITTGSITNPVSTNQTLGNSFNRDTIVLDRAYVRADPYNWLTLWGGRIPNPWFSTELVWDENLNFDGMAVSLRPRFNDSSSGFLTLGAFPLQQADLAITSGSDKWLYGAQLGMDQAFGKHTAAKIGLAYYDYQHIIGTVNPLNGHKFDFTAPQFLQKGNTLFNISNDISKPELYALASDFREFDLTASLDLAQFDPVHVMLIADYVKNLAFDRQTILARAAPAGGAYSDKGHLFKLAVGMPVVKTRGDWQAIATYRYLGSDAVLDAYTDADFHLGGTNTKGWTLGGSYGIAKDTWVSLRYLSADEISGPPLAIDVLQLDLNARF